MQKRGIPGLQLAVVRHGEIVLRGAYGLANIEDSVPVTNQAVFPVNSATKGFTGVAAMQLVEAGRLELDMPVSKYLDGLPSTWQPVTIRQLLSHTSGLPDIVDPNTGRLITGDQTDAAWPRVQTRPVEAVPGKRFSYNQTNYFLLGRILDRINAQPFTEVISNRQFQVVNMPLTRYGDSQDVVPHSARSYTFFRAVNGTMRRTDKLGIVFEEYPQFLRTGAGIETTAEEMARWIIALQKGRFFKDEGSLVTLWTPSVLNDGTLNKWALGWPVFHPGDHRAVGGDGGNRAAFRVYPDDDLAVVILTNLAGGSPESFIDEVAGAFVPEMRAADGFGLPAAIKPLQTQLVKRGFGHAVEVVDEAMAKDKHFRLAESDVDSWGYRLVGAGQLKEAIEIFKLNVRLYPEKR